MNSRELLDEMLRLSRNLDDALERLYEAAHEEAEADDAYRMRKSEHLLRATGTVAEKEAKATLETSEERRRASLAESMSKAYLESVRSKRTQLSALQTIANTYRAEAEFDRTGPNRGVDPS